MPDGNTLAVIDTSEPPLSAMPALDGENPIALFIGDPLEIVPEIALFAPT